MSSKIIDIVSSFNDNVCAADKVNFVRAPQPHEKSLKIKNRKMNVKIS